MSVYSNNIKSIPVIILVILSVCCHNLQENRKLNKISKDFLNQYCQFYPIQATQIGNHVYDDQLDNFSNKNIDKLVQYFKLTLNKIAVIDRNKLSIRNKINYHILSSQSKLHLFELEQWKRWQRDAVFYTKNIYDAVYGLQFHTKDTTENLTRNLMSRLDQIPQMLIDAKKNLQHGNIINLSPAIEQIENQKRIIAFQLSNKFIATNILLDSLNKKSEIVVDSLESFKQFLESKRKTSPNKSLSMTPEMYKTYINLRFNKKEKLEDLLEWIDADYQKYYNDLLHTAKGYLSERKKINEFTRNTNLIELINDEVEKQPLNKDEIIPYCYETINDIRRFIDEIWNLSLPIDYNILIEWAEDNEISGLKLANFKKPGLMEPEPQFYCLLKPISNDRDWIQQLSQLRAYNVPALKIMMMLEAIPSHYQIWSQKLDDIPILARAIPDQRFINAWSYYFAFSMLDAGFEGYDPELRYMLLRAYTRILLLAKVEIQYYQQKLNYQQAEQLLLESKLFKKNEIEQVLKQINYSPGQILTICYGVKQLITLEEACKKKLGPHFSINDFFENLLKPGPIPIDFIKSTALKKFQSNSTIN